MMTECKYCKKTFNHSGHLTRHIRTHTREKPYECSYCKKRFSDSSTLTVHTRIHTGERPFSCKFCKKTFSRSDSLRVHVRTHTGEKKFECHHCRKTFSRSGNLTVHLRTHMSLGANDPCNSGTNGTFECPRCNKSFTQGHDLNRHLKTHHNPSERVDNPLFQAICKTETADARSKPSCCGNNFQSRPYTSANGNLCCKPNNVAFGFDQCNTGNKLTNYINGQPLDKSCNGAIATNLERNKDLPIPVSGHHGNHHCNLQTSNGHYPQLLVQNENKPFDCHGFEKSISHTCQLQRHLQRSLDAGVDSVMAAPSSCDNQNILYMNPSFHGHTGDKSRRCTLCEKSVFHMCQLSGDNYCIPFSGSYNSLTNVTNIPANPMCSSSTDFNRNQACTYIDSRSLSTQQHFGCNHCKNPNHTNNLTDVKPTSFGNQIYIKPDLSSNSSTDPMHNSCAYLNGKSYHGESQFGCENCKTTNHPKDDKNTLASSSASSSQSENDKKPCPTNSSNPLQNQSCSFSGSNHLHMKDQLFGCKQCDVRGFGQPFSMNYNGQHELDIKPNLSIGNLDSNLQTNHYYSNMRTNTSEKQLGCLKPYGQNSTDRKTDVSGSNVAHPSNSFFGLLQSLPEPDVFECDNNAEKPFVPLGGFLNPQASSQKSCLFSSITCNNPEMLDIKPNITSLHDHYHQALTHFSQPDAFSKSDFSTCFSTAQSTLEPNLYDANSAGMGGNVNMGGVTSGAAGMCMKSEPFFCSSGDTQTQPFSYHSLDQPDIKPDLSLLWF